MTTPTYVDAAEVIAKFEELAATSVTRAEYDRHVATTSANLRAWAEELERLRAAHEAHAAHAVDQRPGPDWLHYDFKWAPEIGWTVVSVAVPVILAAIEDPSNVENWRTWAMGLAVAIVRPLLGRLMAAATHRQGQ